MHRYLSRATNSRAHGHQCDAVGGARTRRLQQQTASNKRTCEACAKNQYWDAYNNCCDCSHENSHACSTCCCQSMAPITKEHVNRARLVPNQRDFVLRLQTQAWVLRHGQGSHGIPGQHAAVPARRHLVLRVQRQARVL